MLSAGQPIGAGLVALGALLASFAVLVTEVWGLSRLAFVMGRNGDLPGWIGRLDGRDRLPRRAMLAAGAFLLALAFLADLRPLLEASSLALLAYYWVMNLSALRLPADRRLYPSAVPIAGLAANLLVALSLPGRTLLVVGLVGIIGLAYYRLRHGGNPVGPARG
jgi:APA family basic amino acid/polyamine antiporter